MSKAYVIIIEDEIKEVLETSQGKEGVENTIKFEGFKNATYQEVPTIDGILPGDKVQMYNKDWKLRPKQELVDERYIKLELAEEDNIEGVSKETVIQKVVDNEIVYKTEYDFVKEGAKKLSPFQYIDEENKQIVETMDLKLLVEKGRLTNTERIEMLADQIRVQRDEKIANFEWRYARYNSEIRNGKTPTDSLELLDSYVQSLRDVPQQEGFPENVVWPEEL